jgi:hypothetical protein
MLLARLRRRRRAGVLGTSQRVLGASRAVEVPINSAMALDSEPRYLLGRELPIDTARRLGDRLRVSGSNFRE